MIRLIDALCLFGFSTVPIFINSLIKRGRPQGGRAVFIVDFDGGVVDASKPSGEGAVNCDVAGDFDDFDGGERKSCLLKFPKFWCDFGAGDDFLD
eukprot:CAMPEP_0201727238 /NCGR_PEP_ID=MMETSP0593-20130828/11526_1 /ASSEMBLY_ACC=CAM_ASM_000672 /TAXON_ID=267983 /ORGANISM="Skeletonema japonicum, Strain CCMP2506" /LENGTH=94 /DNA_ID=CAMNT_0048218963 /DNA_START=119 /DNA_END=400 /DNA_ORIENTATION=+